MAITNSKQYRNAINEGGEGYNPFSAREREEAETRNEAAIAKGRAAEEAKMADMIARAPEIRAAWNAAVAKYTAGKSKVTMATLKLIEREAGITLREMDNLRSRLAA